MWGSFLQGQIYLGGAGPQFVPPHTAEWFAADLAQTDPQVFVEEVEHPVPADSLVGEVVAADFVPVYTGPTERVYLRNEDAATLLEPADDGVTWEPVGEPAPGWVAGDGAASSAASTDDQPLLAGTCQRLDGTVDTGPDAETRFVVDDASGRSTIGPRQYLSTAGGAAWSSTDGGELERATWESPSAGPVPFSIVVGADSVALVVDGRVGAAVRTWGDVRVAVRAPADLDDLTVAPNGFGPACSG